MASRVGLLVGLTLFISSASAALAVDGDVVIHEVMVAPPVGAPGFVELYNRGESTVELARWRLGGAIAFEFPASARIGPREAVLVVENVAAARSLFPEASVYGPYAGTLPPHGAYLELASAAGVLVESFHLPGPTHPPSRAEGGGASLERRRPEALAGFADSWGPSPGLLGSPGRLNEIAGSQTQDQASGLRISEVWVGGNENGWLELINEGDAPVSLAGVVISDRATRPAKASFADGLSIAPGEFLVLEEKELGFKLVEAQSIYVSHELDGRLIDVATYRAGGPHRAMARTRRQYGWQLDPVSGPTPGRANVADPASTLYLSEVLYNPYQSEGASDLEWIELHNPTAATLDLTGWRLEGSIEFTFPPDSDAAPFERIVLAKDPRMFEGWYGQAAGFGGYDGALPDEEGFLRVKDVHGRIVDWLRYADDGRWPSAADGNGPSLELVDAQFARADHPGAWRSSRSDGTPGAANSAAREEGVILLDVTYSPHLPAPGETVRVEARVDSLTPVARVLCSYRVAGDAFFSPLLMAATGREGLFAASIPARPAGATVEFFVVASDQSGAAASVPVDAPRRNVRYRVEPSIDPRVLTDGFHLVLSDEDRDDLVEGAIAAGERRVATLVGRGIAIPAVDIGVEPVAASGGGDPDVPVRWVIDLSHDRPYFGASRILLETAGVAGRRVAMELFRGAGVPTPATGIAVVGVGDDIPRTLLRTEPVDVDFLRRHFDDGAGAGRGDLYAASPGADLEYRGDRFSDYEPAFQKTLDRTRDQGTAFVDLVRLLAEGADEPPGASPPPALVAAIDLEEWVAFLAAHAAVAADGAQLFGARSGGFYLYRRAGDGRFVLIPRPFPAGAGGAAGLEGPFPLTGVLAALAQGDGVSEPLASRYGALVRTFFAAPALARLLDGLSAEETAAVSALARDRLAALSGTVEEPLTFEFEFLEWEAARTNWRFHRGRTPPSAGPLDWTVPGFDDSQWEEGKGAFGYGPGGSRTSLPEMQNSYSSVYLRRTFAVADPAEVPYLELELEFDDGFVAFLNGVEIARANVGVGMPSHDARAILTQTTPGRAVFPIPDAGSILEAGDNVIAIVGLNATLDSGDFRLTPLLRSGAVLVEGCDGELFVSGEQVILRGELGASTTAVAVEAGGRRAEVDAATGAWTLPVRHGAGGEVRALDASGQAVAATPLPFRRSVAWGGFFAEDADVRRDPAGPYVVTSPVSIPPGIEMRIGPGCEFLVRSFARVNIQGTLRAVGTAAAPIRFTRVPCGDNWPGLFFDDTRGDNLLQHCELSFSTPARIGCVALRRSDLEVDHCHIHDIDGEGIAALSQCDIVVRHSLVERTLEGIGLDSSRAVVEYNTVRNVLAKSDLVDVNNNLDPPARVAFNSLHGTTDDGIDVDNSTVVVEGNVIRDCGDQGLSLVGSGHATLRNNLIYDCRVGVAAKDGYRADVEFSTIVANQVAGGHAVEETAGVGGGMLTVRNSILWDSPLSLLAERNSTIEASFSCLMGSPWPGEGNFRADPRFLDARNFDFRLQPDSPCVGAASDGSDLGALPLGSPTRFPAGVVVTAANAVRGAEVALRGDVTADDVVDLSDAIFLGRWLFVGAAQPPRCPAALDANADGRVDLADVIYLLHATTGLLVPEEPAPVPCR